MTNKTFRLATRSGRKFTVVWIKDKSQLRPNNVNNSIQDTFLFESMADYKAFYNTQFFKKNGYTAGVGFNKGFNWVQITWFVGEPEKSNRIKRGQIGPRR